MVEARALVCSVTAVVHTFAVVSDSVVVVVSSLVDEISVVTSVVVSEAVV